ncbi:putative NBD/HSP70 family sugar kinase [Branchiibius hedensis]|uniref:Sugar kinase of the NBD/HSP70 family, may contain an N-terminal HTH domain n=1 Tax=Branchiibius hedensis TaxID=672460 RepID=A0A2Y9C2K3_9MICO|nr:ROK family transcriptional regulator [Branchiibius hedensis]PWJ27423.1 putative NBD/HSP70 family sugar kinase [Branchiibius hedensis]SSA36233.1 Sugar kinase of the NBD/HSP70 family, may contain an N-terminal HTH domain [Branchiibius hedensis]
MADQSPVTSGLPDAGGSSTPPRSAASARVIDMGSAGHVLALIRHFGSLTRADILRSTGLARSTVTSRIDALEGAGLITTKEAVAHGRGRPAERFSFNRAGGVFLIAHAGATGVQVAATDLEGTELWREHVNAAVTELSPTQWLSQVSRRFTAALQATGHNASAVRGIGLALPGPVDFEARTLVRPPIMSGWDSYPLADWFADAYEAPVVVENDVNAMALGEQRVRFRQDQALVMVKLATGVGAGIVIGGEIYRGADGAAGDIGHIQLADSGEDPPLCRCGNFGCIEAYAGGWALIRDLRAAGRQIDTVAEAVSLIHSGDQEAMRLSRRAGRILGVALSDVVSLLNPGRLVIGGELADAASHLFAGIREQIYARSLPLATRQLDIVPSTLGPSAGLSGLAAAIADQVFAPSRIDARLGDH